MTLIVPFHWTAEFVLDNLRASITVESDKLNASPHVSFTGGFDGGLGQIVDRLADAVRFVSGADRVRDVCTAWRQLHLREIASLTATEREYLSEVESVLRTINGERFGGTVQFEDIGEADFSNADDIIESRDVITRIETIAGAFEAAGIDPAKLDERESVTDEMWEAAEELEILRNLESAAEPYAGDWRYGETLIRDSHFADYAQELAEDIGSLNKELMWPHNHIDWISAALELQQDYTSVEFDGVTYWIR